MNRSAVCSVGMPATCSQPAAPLAAALLGARCSGTFFAHPLVPPPNPCLRQTKPNSSLELTFYFFPIPRLHASGNPRVGRLTKQSKYLRMTESEPAAAGWVSACLSVCTLGVFFARCDNNAGEGRNVKNVSVVILISPLPSRSPPRLARASAGLLQ